MKTLSKIRSSFLILGLLFLGTGLMAMGSEKEEVGDTINFNTFYGKVVDAASGRPLPFATIEVIGSNVATVSNIDGDFTLKIAKDSPATELKVSYVGFSNEIVPLDKFKGSRTRTISMDTRSVQLAEVTIRPADALELLLDAINSVKKNYSTEPMMMRGFYRETVQRGRNYTSISEAVIDIYKGGYTNDFQVDQVKLFKGRKSADVEKMDTVLFKVQGGPATTMMLDVVKNPYILLSTEYQDIYDFSLADLINIDDRLHYVIQFQQKSYIDDPYYNGKLYVDMERLAITEAEFDMNTDNTEEAARLFIQRKPIGMTIIPEKAAYRAKYTIEDNRWYFSYARAEVKFKVDWKKKLFNTTYSTMSEVAITDRSYEDIAKFAGKERFRSNDVLNDQVYIFFDQDFWGSYNVIEPDQSIESAIRKLNRLYLKRNG